MGPICRKWDERGKEQKRRKASLRDHPGCLPSGNSAPITLSRPMHYALEHKCHARLREDLKVGCSFA